MFQAFDTDWLAAAPLIAAILRHPANIAELESSFRERAHHRARGYGRYSIYLSRARILDTLVPVPLMVLVTSEECDDQGRDYINRHAHPVLHLPSKPLPAEFGVGSLAKPAFTEWIHRVKAYVWRTQPEIGQSFEDIVSGTGKFESLRAGRLVGHRLTLPNDITTVSVGCDPEESALNQDPIPEIIAASYESICKVRDEQVSSRDYPPGFTSLVLTSAGVLKRLPAVMPTDAEGSLGSTAARAYQSVMRQGTLLEPSFGDTSANVSNAATRIYQMRDAELLSQMVAVSVEAAGQFVPTIAIPGGFRSARAALVELDSALRGAARGPGPQIGRAKHAGRELARCLPPFAVEALRSTLGTIKVISDEPLELTDIDGIQLCMRNPVVRLPVTPGFVLTSLVAQSDGIFLHPRDFSRVLILRGTDVRDPVHAVLEEMLGVFRQVATSIDLKILDVHGRGDIRSALDNFSGAILILDAHGIHAERRSGEIFVRDERINFWDGSFKMPPIVLLAACDTHPIYRPQDTLAASVLASGARTVVGTLAPVGAHHAALLFASLLTKIAIRVKRMPGPIRWSEFFALHQWWMHVYEAVVNLDRAGVTHLGSENALEISRLAEIEMLRFNGGWRTVAVGELARRSGMTDSQALDAWQRFAYMTPSALYCQLGQADSVFLAHSDDWLPSPGSIAS